jgi:hypothetical protein
MPMGHGSSKPPAGPCEKFKALAHRSKSPTKKSEKQPGTSQEREELGRSSDDSSQSWIVLGEDSKRKPETKPETSGPSQEEPSVSKSSGKAPMPLQASDRKPSLLSGSLDYGNNERLITQAEMRSRFSGFAEPQPLAGKASKRPETTPTPRKRSFPKFLHEKVLDTRFLELYGESLVDCCNSKPAWFVSTSKPAEKRALESVPPTIAAFSSDSTFAAIGYGSTSKSITKFVV